MATETRFLTTEHLRIDGPQKQCLEDAEEHAKRERVPEIFTDWAAEAHVQWEQYHCSTEQHHETTPFDGV